MKNIKRTTVIILLMLYLGALFYMSLRSGISDWRVDLPLNEYFLETSNIIPFSTIGYYISSIFNQSINIDIALYNLFVPVVAFIPFGTLLYLITKNGMYYKKYYFHIF